MSPQKQGRAGQLRFRGQQSQEGVWSPNEALHASSVHPRGSESGALLSTSCSRLQRTPQHEEALRERLCPCSWSRDLQEQGPAPLMGSRGPDATEKGLVFAALTPMKITGFRAGLESGSFPLAKELDQEGLQV